MTFRIGTLACLAFSAFGPALASDEAAGSGEIAVVVASGRRFVAQLDTRTDGSRLWLRWTQGESSLLRPIAWDRVVRVEADGREFSGEEFRRAVQTAVADGLLGVEPPPPAVSAPSAFPVQTASASAPRSAHSETASRVASVAIDVRTANWNADVNPDGLLVDVYPLDVEGRPVAVRGTLEVDLVDDEVDRHRPAAALARVGRWTERVEPDDFSPSGAARYRLPFQAVHPDFDRSWAIQGLVHARLSVPGEGVFEASQSRVRLREFSPLRDRYEQATGRRYFQQELTSRPGR